MTHRGNHRSHRPRMYPLTHPQGHSRVPEDTLARIPSRVVADFVSTSQQEAPR